MAQSLKELAVLPENLSLIPSTHLAVKFPNCNFRGSNALFWLLQAPSTQWHTGIHRGKTFIHIIVLLFLKKNKEQDISLGKKSIA